MELQLDCLEIDVDCAWKIDCLEIDLCLEIDCVTKWAGVICGRLRISGRLHLRLILVGDRYRVCVCNV